MNTLLSLPLFALFLCLTGCWSYSTQRIGGNLQPGSKIHHIVLCWLKEPGNEEHREQIIKASKLFRDIPGVLNSEAGRVVSSDRTIVDDTFDVGILVVVESQNDLKTYLEHPIHQRAKKETLSPLVDRILVYDFQD
jgi:hypothetical protein